MRYRTMEELIETIDRPIKIKIYDVYHKYKAEFLSAQGSQHNHQAWAGGLLDHVVDAMNIARLLYVTMNEKRQLPFSMSDAIVVLFLHDIEKLFPYRIEKQMEMGVSRPKAKSKIRYRTLHDEGIWEHLSEAQKNAIDFAEGEGDSYTNERRVMQPLAAFVHMCDTASARIWFDNPYANKETWGWRESNQGEQLWGV